MIKQKSTLNIVTIIIFTLSVFSVQNMFAENFKLINGKWFDGQTFCKQTVWVYDGKLSFESKNIEPDKVIDLSGRYVTPPFAEAHNHNLESEYELDKRIANYFSHGVFYVKVQSSIKKRMLPLMNKYNHPLGLDISLTYAPITGTDGHPIGVRKWYLEQGYFGDLFKTLEEIESHGYFTVNSKKQLHEKWGNILSFKPDFIKVMLAYSEEYKKRKDDKAYFGKKGLNPKLLLKVIKLAHQKGLRVSVHVSTPADFRQAIKSGADEIAHLPGISSGLKLTQKDAKLAAQKDVVVITTASLVTKRKKLSNYNQLVEIVKHNLKILKDGGVKLAIGSDMYNDTSSGEVAFLSKLGVFSNLELIKMWTENSAKTIFPSRKIGKLKDGYEASFLVFQGNPIENLGKTLKIEMRVKQGHILE